MNNVTDKEKVFLFFSKEVKEKANELFNSNYDSAIIEKYGLTFYLRKVNNEHINFGYTKLSNILRFEIIGFITSSFNFTALPKYINVARDNGIGYNTPVEIKSLGIRDRILISVFSMEGYEIAKKVKDIKIEIDGLLFEFVRTFDNDINVFWSDELIGIYFITTSKGIGFSPNYQEYAVDLNKKRLLSCLTPH